jgi:hypothetical protein
VAFGHGVLFEAIFVATLLFARCAVPPQALEAFSLHFVAQPFGAAYFGFGHLGGVVWYVEI